jgi:hypothetical protein
MIDGVDRCLPKPVAIAKDRGPERIADFQAVALTIASAPARPFTFPHENIIRTKELEVEHLSALRLNLRI